MNTRTPARRAGRRLAVQTAGLAAIAALTLGLSACQTGATVVTRSTTAPAPRPAVAAPAGIDTAKSADRIDEAIARQKQELAQRFAGVPADRVADTLAREALAAAQSACARHLLETGNAGSDEQAMSLCITGAPLPSTHD